MRRLEKNEPERSYRIGRAASAVLLLTMLAGCLSTDPEMAHDELRKARLDAVRLNAPDAPMTDEALPILEGELNLRDACNLALGGNLTLRSTFLKRQEAAGAVEEARGRAFPLVDLNAGVSRVLNNAELKDNHSAALKITQPLWRSGIIEAGIRYAKFYSASTDAEIREQVQRVLADVIGSYLDALLQDQLTRVYEESLAVAERLLRTAKSKRLAGTVSDYEVLRAEVEVSTARADLLNARNQLQTTLIALLHALGADQKSEIALTDSLVYQAESYEDAAVVARALEARPDLVMREAAVRMARAQLAAVKAEYGPEADLFVTGTLADPDPNNPRESGWGDRWMAGASVTYTLFDGFARRGRMSQMQARVVQAEAVLKDAEESAKSEVAQALLNLRYADELYQSQKKNIELAQEALRILESGFRMGRNTQIEVLDAQSALTEAMGRYYNAVHLHSKARLKIRQVMGVLGPADEWIVLAGYRLDDDPLNGAEE